MNVVLLKGAEQAPKSARSRMDTIIITPDVVKTWMHPPFQRPLKVNAKVRAIAEELKHNGGVINGMLTLGQIDHNKSIYLMDGQHRVEAAMLSGLAEAISDVRICQFDSMADMGEEFVKLNSSIVRMNPDDIMRGMEGTVAVIHNLREACSFVGYENIRRTPDAPVLSLSSAVRCWVGSHAETPKAAVGSALSVVTGMSVEEGDELAKFLKVAWSAWGRDAANYRLWAGLNLCMAMWMWRRLVTDRDRAGMKRYVLLNTDLFKKCLMQVSANADYIDWLAGRTMTERNRAPCYQKLKTEFVMRLRSEMKQKKINLPQPAWSVSR